MIEATTQDTDKELDPSSQPGKAAPWLNMLTDAEKAFKTYQEKADNVDKLYADLKKLSGDGRDREFQLFWANVQVLGPSIYARPPVPVVTPKFKDRRRLYQVSSEFLERACNVAFDMAGIDETMKLLRDDLAIQARGVAVVRYETKAESDTNIERVCVDHVDRKDFLHEPARKWPEVGWVAFRSYLTKKQVKERFEAYADKMAYGVNKEAQKNGAADPVEKAEVWEIWSRTENKVVWVSHGVEDVLDEGKPHLKLEGFFPCPKPAYATVQRRSLVPIQDMLFYKDQLEEVNQLTARIHALADALRVRGFYPGAAELGDAIETALKITDDRKVMIPVSNWAAFGSTGGDPIVWLPIDMIAEVVSGLVELRRQVIDDVYQIMGLSDIMRGSTEKDETATAQNLKAQYGSVRIRDKQSELVRIARDLVRIAAEIMAEEFAAETLLAMTQMDLPTDKDIRTQVEQIASQAEQQAMQMMQQPPPPDQAERVQQQVQQIVQQATEQAKKLADDPTVEKVMAFLRSEKLRPFVLDIETDSTIQPDEQAEKEARTEFVTALGGTLQQFTPLIQGMPAFAPLVGEILKFALAPFRAGRELDAKIDEAVEQMSAMASQPQPNPEQEKMQAEMAMKQQELQAKAQIEQQKIAAEQEAQKAEAAFKAQENEAKLMQLQAQMARDEQKGQLELQKLQMEIAAKQAELQFKREGAQLDAQVAQQKAQIDMQSATQQAEIKNRQAEQAAQHSEQAFEQKSALNEQTAMRGSE